MPAGRPAKPTAIKRLEGNPGKRALNKREPTPKGSAVPAPEMSERALKVWKRLTGAMVAGVYTQADEALMMVYCEAVAEHHAATEMLKTEPRLVKGSTGQLVPSPWLKIRSDQARIIAQVGPRLGLDPVSRQAISAPDAAPDDGGFNIH
jgi:P27 family predicted phage terminase small subunit